MDTQKTTGRNRISELMESSLDGVRGLVDANTVVGDPIVTPNATIIPISKMSVGFVGGGNDYAGKNSAAVGKNNLGGGSGTGLSVTPVGFLVIHIDGKVEVLNMSGQKGDDLASSIETIMSKAPEVVNKIKTVIDDKKKKKEEKKAAEKAAEEEASQEGTSAEDASVEDGEKKD